MRAISERSAEDAEDIEKRRGRREDDVVDVPIAGVYRVLYRICVARLAPVKITLKLRWPRLF